MANIKVSQMTEATSFDDGDYTMIVQANQNKKISKENIFSNLEDEISTNSSNISTINTNIGTLSNLETDDKSSLVNSINELKNGEVYSLNEVKTNKIWIDSNNVEHSIYRKYIEVGSLTQNVEKTVDTNTNIDFFTEDITGFYNFSGFLVPINFSNLGSSYSNANYSYCFFDKTNQQFRIKTTYNGVTGCYLIIEYVKGSD